MDGRSTAYLIRRRPSNSRGVPAASNDAVAPTKAELQEGRPRTSTPEPSILGRRLSIHSVRSLKHGRRRSSDPILSRDFWCPIQGYYRTSARKVERASTRL